MKKLSMIAAVAMVAVLSVAGAASADEPKTHQDFEAKLFAGSKPGKTPGKGSIGTYLKPFHNQTWPAVPDKNSTKGALGVSPPFATVIAYVYLDKNVKFDPTGFPACDLDTVKAMAPENQFGGCPKGSVLGKGVAAGYARVPGAAAGAYSLAPELVTRVVSSGKKNGFYLFTYNETTKGNVIMATIQKASGKFGSRIEFVLPTGLIFPGKLLVSQLSSFDATIPAQTSKGKALITLKKCPSNKKVSVGYQGLYSNNATAKPGVNPEDGKGYLVTSKSDIITRTGKCK